MRLLILIVNAFASAPSVLCLILYCTVFQGAREPWRQSRRGSHKISTNGAKIGLGSRKFSEVID